MRQVHVIAIAALLLVTPPLRAGRVELEKPVAISTIKADRKPLDGRLVAYDEEGFELVRGKDKTVKVRWSELAAPGLFNVRSAIAGPRAGADAWVEVGRAMLEVEGGEAFADRAFARALKLDPKAHSRIEEAKQLAAKAPEASPQGVQTTPTTMDTTPDAGDNAPVAAGPRVVGKVQAGPWPAQTDEQRAARVEELKKFAGEAGRKLDKELVLQETKYFLFYSDLPAAEARDWASLLDRMYARLAELFAIERQTGPATASTRPGGRSSATTRGTGAGRGDFVNIWAGKALVFVFRSADDYRRFQEVVHKTDAGSSAGMCHCFGDGRVHIAFYRQQDQLTFAHVLVHESVHGFVHRFRTPKHVPSWANEGLAEVIASELVPRNGRGKERELMAKMELQRRPELGGMLEARHIDGWAYPVAETLCAYMIRQNKRNYVDFINGIKDGLTWEQSLEQRYKAPRQRLAQAYRASLGLRD